MTIYDDSNLIKQLAIALTEKPRSTIQELAIASGISKATLYRFCKTRENLDKILLKKASDTVNFIIETAEKDYEDYIVGLKELIQAHFKEVEIFRWVCTQPHSVIKDNCSPNYFCALDKFFLNGQKKGVFRIDFSVNFLSNIFMSSICGLIDAERQGRIQR